MTNLTHPQACSPTNRLKVTFSILLIICCIYTAATLSADNESDKPSGSEHSSSRRVRFADSDSAPLSSSSSQTILTAASQKKSSSKKTKWTPLKKLFTSRKNDFQASSNQSLYSHSDSEIAGRANTPSLHSCPSRIQEPTKSNKAEKKSMHYSTQASYSTAKSTFQRSRSMRARGERPKSHTSRGNQYLTPQAAQFNQTDTTSPSIYLINDKELTSKTGQTTAQIMQIKSEMVTITTKPNTEEYSNAPKPTNHPLTLSTFQKRTIEASNNTMQPKENKTDLRRAKSLPRSYKHSNTPQQQTTTHLPGVTFTTRKSNKERWLTDKMKSNSDSQDNQCHMLSSFISEDNERSFEQFKKIINSHIDQYIYPVCNQRNENKKCIASFIKKIKDAKKKTGFEKKYLPHFPEDLSDLLNDLAISLFISSIMVNLSDSSFGDYKSTDFSSTLPALTSTAQRNSHAPSITRLLPIAQFLERCVSEMIDVISEGSNYISLKYSNKTDTTYHKITSKLLTRYIVWITANYHITNKLTTFPDDKQIMGYILLVLVSCIALEQHSSDPQEHDNQQK